MSEHPENENIVSYNFVELNDKPNDNGSSSDNITIAECIGRNEQSVYGHTRTSYGATKMNNNMLRKMIYHEINKKRNKGKSNPISCDEMIYAKQQVNSVIASHKDIGYDICDNTHIKNMKMKLSKVKKDKQESTLEEVFEYVGIENEIEDVEKEKKVEKEDVENETEEGEDVEINLKIEEKETPFQKNAFSVVDEYEISMANKTKHTLLKNISLDIRGEIPNPKVQVEPWNNSSYIPKEDIVSEFAQPFIGLVDAMNEKINSEQIKEENIFPYVVDTVFKMISNDTSKCDDISKLVHQNKNILQSLFKNANNSHKNKDKQIVLINFEDDTFKSVISIDKAKLDIINGWYSTCKQLVDIEETQIIIPNDIENEIRNIINNELNMINCNHKEMFIQSYAPEIIHFVQSRNRIKLLNKQLSIQLPECENINKKTDVWNLDKLNINVPDNLFYTDSYFYKKDGKTLLFTKYNKQKKEKTEKDAGHIGTFDASKNKDTDITRYKRIDDAKNMITDIIQQYNASCNKTEQPINEVKSYNDPYNALCPAFGSNCQEINEQIAKKEESKYDNSKLVIVLFNPKFFQTIVTFDPDLIILETIFEHKEYGFMELFTINTNNEEIELLVRKQYDGVIFNNAEELNSTMSSTSQFFEYIKSKEKNKEDSKEEEVVKEYLNKFYVLSDDINKKMKASALYDSIISSEICTFDNKFTLSGFRNRLSVYLKKLGLQKKRYNDGYYYYGITPILNNYNANVLLDFEERNKNYTSVSKASLPMFK
jgi:hypothetical protein